MDDDQSLAKTVDIVFVVTAISPQVCGDIPENALYVDAVSVEDRTPWYEMKVRHFVNIVRSQNDIYIFHIRKVQGNMRPSS